MLSPISREKNLENLKYISNRLRDVTWFVFFGTLLGYTRENNILENDDDIDIYVDIRFREKIIDLFTNSDLNFDLSKKPNLGPYFLQGTRVLENEITYVDFYFYEYEKSKEFIIERNNFSGAWKIESNAMHIPKNIIFPVKRGGIQDIKIFIPNKPIKCCEFLYGKDWKIPLSKSKDYLIDIINNRPMLVKKNKFKIKL